RSPRTAECPLSGVKRTWRLHCEMSANDPKRTLLSTEQSDAPTITPIKGGFDPISTRPISRKRRRLRTPSSVMAGSPCEQDLWTIGETVALSGSSDGRVRPRDLLLWLGKPMMPSGVSFLSGDEVVE